MDRTVKVIPIFLGGLMIRYGGTECSFYIYR